jgi:hypothetical protein
MSGAIIMAGCAPNWRKGVKITRTRVNVLEFRNHEAFVIGLMTKIPAEAKKLERQNKKGQSDSQRKRWTKAVKNVFRTEGLALGRETIDFYGTHQGEEKNYREWLLDAILYVEGRGVLVAVESEFERNVQGIIYDFWKLLSIKAPLKILIIDSRKQGTRYFRRLFEVINAYARGFEQHLPREIYYLLDFHDNRRDAYRYVIGSTCHRGRVECFSFKHLPKLSGPEK